MKRKVQKNRSKSQRAPTLPACIDLHMHGAFGIDLMQVSAEGWNTLAEKLLSENVVGFCPTTLSAPWQQTLEAVSQLGEFTVRQRKDRLKKQAISHGLHLEGPFLNPAAAGAHPQNSLLSLSLEKLDQLWKSSQRTVKIITLAPELLSPTLRKEVLHWAKPKEIRLNIGHTRASFEEARVAFDEGFSGLTHAWNAMAFHHRDPGALGAALRKYSTTFVEIIPDGIHVHPELVGWIEKLLPKGTIWVSDSAPSAGLPFGSRCAFGPLQIESTRLGARIVPQDSNTPLNAKNPGVLAGGGSLLSALVRQHLLELKNLPPSERKKAVKQLQKNCFENPKRYLEKI